MTKDKRTTKRLSYIGCATRSTRDERTGSSEAGSHPDSGTASDVTARGPALHRQSSTPAPGPIVMKAPELDEAAAARVGRAERAQPGLHRRLAGRWEHGGARREGWREAGAILRDGGRPVASKKTNCESQL